MNIKKFTKYRIVSFISLFLCLVFLLSLPSESAEETEQTEDSTQGNAWDEFRTMVSAAPESEQVNAAYLYNIENSVMLYEKNAEEIIFPASTVKIMTGLIACEMLSDRLDERVTITSNMLAGSAGRNMQLTAGEEILIKDLLYGFICGGYNDAACAAAAITSGSVSAFIDDMNEKAKLFGMKSTVYTNPTGLHDDDMVTTAHDTALLAKEASGNALYMEICSAQSYEIAATNVSDARYFTNRNSLVSGTNAAYYNGYCKGMNSGSTDEGGFCTVTLWQRNGASNVCVVMGGIEEDNSDVNYTYRYVNSLLSWASSEFAYRNVLVAGKALDTQSISMTGTSKSESDILAASSLSLYLPRSLDIENALVIDCHYDSLPLSAPLSKGEVVGRATVSFNGHSLGSLPLAVEDGFEENGFLKAMMGFKDYLGSRAFVFTLICFILLILFYLRWISAPGKRFVVKKRKRRYF